MYLGKDKNKAPGTANRQTECAGCPQGSSQRIALSLFYHKAGHFTRKTLSENRQKNLMRKKEVEQWHFLQQR